MKLSMQLLVLFCFLFIGFVRADQRQETEKSFKDQTPECIFSTIYNTNYWMGSESLSGQGSSLSTTRTVRQILAEVLRTLDVKIILDAPCGDFNWMKEVDASCLDLYLGADIVPDMIKVNQQRYGSSKRVFFHADIITDPLPKADLIFCRDCLQHLSLEQAQQVINNFKASGATWLLMSTHKNGTKNVNIQTGRYYPINMMLPPFNFPKPIFIMDEVDVELASRADGKCLALWRLADLPSFSFN